MYIGKMSKVLVTIIYCLVVYTIHTYLQETVNFLHISRIDLAHLTHFKHMQCIT